MPIDESFLSRVGELPPEEREEIAQLLSDIDNARKRENASERFIDFVRAVWPAFISGRHHKIMADAFDRILSGKLRRLIINMPPRHTKSEFTSFHLPAFALGVHPDWKIIQAAHTGELAVGFGRKVRDLIKEDDEYRRIFPGTTLKADATAAGRWNTAQKGEYYAIGVGGTVTGRGADLFIIDDPHSEQEAIMAQSDPKVFDKVYEWYTSGPRQRLQPGAAIILVMTRWGTRDLTARVLKAAAERKVDIPWEVIEFPAIMPSGNPLWPEYWPIEELEALRDELPNAKWQAQYQQQPTNDAGALIKRSWWKIWDREKAPECEFVIQSWDTAFLKTETADYSACTTWGVFYRANEIGKEVPNIILLDAFKDRLEFPALKRKARELWEERKPDAFIIEGKAAGMPLIFELRAMGIPVQEFTPTRGNDKIARVNAVSDLFASGIVWAPETRWADEVMDECAAFPMGEHDDYVDTVSQALLRFRQGGFISVHTDEDDEEFTQRPVEYY